MPGSSINGEQTMKALLVLATVSLVMALSSTASTGLAQEGQVREPAGEGDVSPSEQAVEPAQVDALTPEGGIPRRIPVGATDEMFDAVQAICPRVQTMEQLDSVNQWVWPAIEERSRLGMQLAFLRLGEAYVKCFERVDVSGTPLAENLERITVGACLAPAMMNDRGDALHQKAVAIANRLCPVPVAFGGGDLDAFDAWYARASAWLVLAAGQADESRFVSVGQVCVDSVTQVLGTEYPEEMWRLRESLIISALRIGDFDAALRMAGGAGVACGDGLPVDIEDYLPSVHPVESTLKQGKSDDAVLESLLKAAADGLKTQGADCALTSLAASLALNEMDFDHADRLAAPDGVDSFVSIVVADNGRSLIPGNSASRVTVLTQAVKVSGMSSEVRGGRLCELGLALLEEGLPREADDAFRRARAELPESGMPVAFAGHFLVAMHKSGSGVADRDIAARNLLMSNPSDDLLNGVLDHLGGPNDRVRAIESLFRASFATGETAIGIVANWVVGLVDSRPGSPEASRCVALMEENSVGEDESARLVWLAIRARHEFVKGDSDAGFGAVDSLIKLASSNPSPVAARMLAKVASGMIQNRKPEIAVGIVTRAARKAALSGGDVARTAIETWNAGFKKEAATMLRIAKTVNGNESADQVWIATAAVTMQNLPAATEAVSKFGDRSEWGMPERLAYAAFLMLKKDFAGVVAELSGGTDDQEMGCVELSLRALALMMNGDPAAAESDFRSCMLSQGAEANLLSGLAWSLFDQKKYDEAIDYFAAALTAFRDSPDSNVGMALALFRNGDLERARLYWEKAIEAEPVFTKGPVFAGKAGYLFSTIQRKAWVEMRVALGKKPVKGGR